MSKRRPLRITLLILLAACGGDSTTPIPKTPEIHGAADLRATATGDNQTGTVNHKLEQPVSIQITDRNGVPVPGMSVTFSPLGLDGPFLAMADAVTDAEGRASAIWPLGMRAGVQMLEVTTNLNDVLVVLDTLHATAKAGPALRVNLASRQYDLWLSITAGTAFHISIVARDAFDNEIPAAAFTPSMRFLRSGIATVDASGTVTGVSAGRDTLRIAVGAAVRYLPVNVNARADTVFTLGATIPFRISMERATLFSQQQ